MNWGVLRKGVLGEEVLLEGGRMIEIVTVVNEEPGMNVSGVGDSRVCGWIESVVLCCMIWQGRVEWKAECNVEVVKVVRGRGYTRSFSNRHASLPSGANQKSTMLNYHGYNIT